MKHVISSIIKPLSLVFCVLAIAISTLVFAGAPAVAHPVKFLLQSVASIDDFPVMFNAVSEEEELEKGITGRTRDEFFEGMGNKGISGRTREEFFEGMGNKGISGRTREEFFEGMGNKGITDRTGEDFLEEGLGDKGISGRTREEFFEGMGNQ
ncbi:MAG: hypothetical protein VKK04_13570 [Synechococcales bacterium]|nr:hypothetical protein [Synechococcales bacterium]